MRLKFRTNVIPMSSGNIDKENNRISNVVAMQVGEAMGHDMMADNKTLQLMANLGNGNRRGGVEGRFGHPGMSDNAMGKKLFFAKNFQVVGNRLLHDIEFYDWARLSPVFDRDPIEYIFERAEKNPESFGESVVIKLDTVWILENGEEISADGDKPENVLHDLRVMRPTHFYFADMVSDGALTPNGLFSSDANLLTLFEGTSSIYAEQAFRLMDELCETYGISEDELARKVPNIINSYKYWRAFNMPTNEKDETPLAQDKAKKDTQSELATVLEETAALTSDIVEPDEAADEIVTDFVPRADYDALLKQHQTLQETFIAFAKQSNQQYKALLKQFGELKQEFAKLNGEEVVTGKVPSQSPLDAIQAQIGNTEQFSALPDPVTQRQAHLGEIVPTGNSDEEKLTRMAKVNASSGLIG